MAIAFSVAEGKGLADGSASTTWVSDSFSVSGTDRVMYVLAGGSDDPPQSVSGVVWSVGSQSFTNVGSEIAVGSYGKCQLWRLIAPGTGSGTITVTYAGPGNHERILMAWCGTGINQTTPNGTVVTNNSTSGTSVTATHTGVANGQTVLVFGYYLDIDGSNRTFNSPTGTERLEELTSGTTYDGMAVQDQVATGTTISPSWTLSAAVNGGWAIFVIPLNLPAAGPDPITAASGSFTLTGNAASLLRKHTLTAASGTFTFTGNAATLIPPSTNKTMGADVGTFTFTGNAAGLSKTKRLIAETGVFTFTGDDALIDRSLKHDSASFVVTGNAATLRYGKTLTAARGQFSYTGQDVNFDFLPPGDFAYSAELGVFSVTGNNAGLRRTWVFPSARGTFTYTGIAATFKRTYVLAANTGAFDFRGKTLFLVHQISRRRPNPRGFLGRR